MPYGRVHSKRLGVDLVPFSVGLHGAFLVTSLEYHSITGEPDTCWFCKEMTMDGYMVKLSGMDTASTGNASPFSYILRVCRKHGIQLLTDFLPF
jgi:hypothetical protein